ncbi:MAG: DNA polymerase IV [Candidatus Sumerlaeia bacterium]|nr:DNA polymerase IV [Candidatus Sumerlaeia bacterium]
MNGDSQPATIIHLDMDSFFVSVERLLDPTLNGKPVAVGGPEGGRGVISSASYEARLYGVRSAMPVSKARQLCPQLVLVHGKLANYSEYSRQIHDILLRFTPMVQMASQDEAYMDMTGTSRLWGPILRAAETIRQEIVRETRLPCSLGVGSNKLVAKIASGLCKPRGLLYIPAGSEEKFMAPLPIRRIPGIGPKAGEKLRSLGIERAGQLAALNSRLAERHFGTMAPQLLQHARGMTDSPVVTGELPKSIGNEVTFDTDQNNREFLHGILSTLAEKVAWRLRSSGCHARTITVKYRYTNFETHTAASTLANPVDDESEILAHARQLLDSRWDAHRPLRLIGVTAGNLVFGNYQEDFLEAPKDERLDRLHRAIDNARDRHGYTILRRGGSSGRNA